MNILIGRKYSSGNDIIDSTTTVVVDAESGVDSTYTANQSNKQLDFAVVVAQAAAIYILTSRAITIKTNDSGSPTDTLTLPAGGSIVWLESDGTPCPFTGDVSKLFITNTDNGVGTIQVRLGYNATP